MGNDDLVIRGLRDLQDRVGDLQANVGELRVETRANTAVIADLGGRMDGLGGRMDGLGGRFDVVEDTLKDVASQQLMLTKYVKHSIGRHERAIEGLDDRVTRLEDEA